MQIKVEAVTKEPRIWQGKTQWGVKIADGWLTLHRDARPVKGEVIDVTIQNRAGNNGQTYRDALPVAEALKPPTPQPEPPAEQKKADPNAGKISWDDYRTLAEAAHGLALKLEPDEYGDEVAGIAHIRTDKSTARMAFVNTTLIAYGNGKIYVPKDDDDGYIPPPDDSDAPPF